MRAVVQRVSRANVVVLGRDTRQTLFKDQNGIGERIHIGNIPFTVIGEFEPKGKMLGASLKMKRGR